MAVKLSAKERAKIRLGDFGYTPEQLREMTARIEAEDEELAADPPRPKNQKETTKYEWRGEDLRHTIAEMNINGVGVSDWGGMDSLARAVAERDKEEKGNTNKKKKKDMARPASALSESIKKSREKAPAEEFEKDITTAAAIVDLRQDATERTGKAGRPRKHSSGKQVSIWLEENDLRALRIKAAERGVSVSELAAAYIRIGLND